MISKDGLFSADHFSKLPWDVNVCQDVNICLSEVDLLGKICFFQSETNHVQSFLQKSSMIIGGIGLGNPLRVPMYRVW